MQYLRDPEAIYAKSFSTIRAEADFSHLPADAEPMAVRIVHACGLVDAARELVITHDFVRAARAATGPVIVDAEMVRHGIIPRLVRNRQIICTLNDPRARDLSTTRSAAAVNLWRDHMAGSVIAIGNAPTALFRLLEILDDGAPRPAAIIGFPVGFVGAAESKAALISNPRGLPFAAIRGRMGGSAMAAAAINALLETPA